MRKFSFLARAAQVTAVSRVPAPTLPASNEPATTAALRLLANPRRTRSDRGPCQATTPALQGRRTQMSEGAPAKPRHPERPRCRRCAPTSHRGSAQKRRCGGTQGEPTGEVWHGPHRLATGWAGPGAGQLGPCHAAPRAPAGRFTGAPHSRPTHCQPEMPSARVLPRGLAVDRMKNQAPEPPAVDPAPANIIDAKSCAGAPAARRRTLIDVGRFCA